MSKSPATPLVSIVIPVFNGANYLAEAIDSALAQTWTNTEIIVVNDGSDDGGRTADVAAQYGNRIRYYHKTNGGVATAINRGISLMRGQYFSWLSHDDVFAPEKIDRMMKAVLSYGEPVVAFGDYAEMDARGESVREIGTGRAFDGRQPVWAVLEGRLNGCSMLIPKECFRVCGYMRPDLPATQDNDLWFRMALKFQFVHVPGVMVYQRQHDDQGSRSRRFRSEVQLLYLSFLDRITDEVVASHAASKVDFYGRFHRYPVSRGVAAAIGRELRNLSQPLHCAALIQQTKPALDEALVSGRSHDGEIPLMETVFFNQKEDAVSLLTASREDTATLNFKLVLADASTSTWERLYNLVAKIKSEYIWVTPRFPYSQRIDMWPALEGLLASPAAVACIREYEDGRLSSGSLGVLEGAVLRTRALESALHESTESLSSLLHALSRQGAIKTNLVTPENTADAAAERALPTIAGAPKQSNDRASHSAPAPTLVQRAWTFLSRSPLLSRGAVNLVCWITGGGQEAADRLLARLSLDDLFDGDWYRRRYPDIAQAGSNPAWHFLMFGRFEGRDPSPRFSAKGYVADHPDVAVHSLPAVQQYAVFGRRERLKPRPAVLRYAALPGLADDGRPGVLFVLPEGADDDMARFANDLSTQIRRRLRAFYLVAHGDGTVSIGTAEDGKDGSAFELPLGMDAAIAELRFLGVERIVILNVSGFNGFLPPLLNSISIPFDLVHFGHDKPNVELDSTHDWVVEHADQHFALSDDSAQRLTQSGMSKPIRVAPPPDPDRLRTFRVWARQAVKTEPLRIALFGSLDVHSGALVLHDILARTRSQSLPLRFFVFGDLQEPLPARFADLCTVVAASDPASLTEETCRWRPHLAWFPYPASSSYCYPLTDAQANGLPVAATAIGAFVERLQHRPLSWLLPPQSSADDWVAFFLQLQQNGMITEWNAPLNAPAPLDDHSLYQHHLIRSVLGENRAGEASHS